ncbi:MAG: deoxyribodipyrimidine photo-lyase [Candidatus Eisenbacteria bacterium]
MRILHWFRKDLRLGDNTALSEACRDAGGDVVPFYMSEPAILGRPDMAAARVRFVLESLASLRADIEALGSSLGLGHGEAAQGVVRAARAARADAVYWNDEYEPQLRARDDAVEHALVAAGHGVRRFHDRLLAPPGLVATGAGTPFVVYTPFRRACEKHPLAEPHRRVTRLAQHGLPQHALATLAQLGFPETAVAPWPAGETAANARLERFLDGIDAATNEGLAGYDTHRDFPAVHAVSRLSADLRFGTIGIRQVTQAARAAAHAVPRLAKAVEKFVSELRWRDFYAQVMFHHPHCERGCFRPEYDALPWSGTPEQLDAWKQGRTGYPIVDAGMRELLATGFMHNRVRMLAASFLTKDLLIDWRQGERHFMQHLIDGDLANNNGGWQWAAGTGTDAAPYFRIFNPVSQGQRFDADGVYVRRWIPELSRLPAAKLHRPWEVGPLDLAASGVTLGETYPYPIVDHSAQRERALAMYAAVKDRL